MANQLHADASQQLEVTLLGSPAAEIMDILSASLPKLATVTSAQPHPCTFTGTPPASVPLKRITELSSAPVMVMAGSSKPDEEIPASLEASKTKISNIPVTTTLVSLSTSAHPSTSSVQSLSTGPATTIATIVVPELAIPADAYPECINRPGIGKDYLYQICYFSHTNLDSVLTHIRRHLDITVGCPICCKGYQNAALVWKHGREATPLQGPTDPM